MKFCVNTPHFHQIPFWPKQMWAWWWTVNTKMLPSWDKATLCICVQSWMHMWCGWGDSGADLLPQTCMCSVLCTLKTSYPQKEGWTLPELFICLPGGSVITEGVVKCLSIWISVWSYHCQLYQQCVNGSAPMDQILLWLHHKPLFLF